MVTIHAVAREAGVSVATVSRVLNKCDTVRPATAKRVQEAIDRLNYVPNQSARNLRCNESHVILTLAPNFSNPYYSRILTGIGDLAHEMGYSVLICNTEGHEGVEKNFLEMLETHRADGAIFLGCPSDYLWLADYAERYPIVQCCEFVPELDISSVSIDNYAAATEVVCYLQSLGHERIAFLGADNKLISTKLRRQGYEDAMQAAGLKIDPLWYGAGDEKYSFVSGLIAAKQIFNAKPRPTAVFCVSDILALSTISAAQNMGLRVPEDVSVTGIDDVDYTTMFHPYLTTVAQPCYEMGKKSLSVLLDLIQGRTTKAERQFIPYHLALRESAAACQNNKTVK